MSLRLRLTLLSTLVMAVVSILFGVLAYLSVSKILFQTVDDNLERQSSANLAYILMRPNHDLSQLNKVDTVGTVFYTVINSEGHVILADRPMPLDEGLIASAMSGVGSTTTLVGLDGSKVRVVVKPIRYVPSGQTVGVLQAATPLDYTEEVLRQLRLLLVVISAVLLLVAAAGSWILTRRALRVVEGVADKASQIELSQDLSQRIPEPGTDDEVGHLVSTFNGMIARLEDAFNAQRRFVADSSHELRTPLTVIRSNLHLLRRTVDAAERSDLIETTEAEVARLNRMVNDLLYIAQMQAGHDIEPVIRPVELDGLLLDAFAKGKSLARLKGQEITLVHEDIANTSGDREQLAHLILNLVDNASKYTPEGGTISLGLWNEGAMARIEVRDTGTGIPEELVPRIFDRFYRTQSARASERSGAGLGLSIVKSIVEKHRGRIQVASTPGEGATFTVWLPIASGSAAQDRRPKSETAMSLPERAV